MRLILFHHVYGVTIEASNNPNQEPRGVPRTVFRHYGVCRLERLFQPFQSICRRRDSSVDIHINVMVLLKSNKILPSTITNKIRPRPWDTTRILSDGLCSNIQSIQVSMFHQLEEMWNKYDTVFITEHVYRNIALKISTYSR